MMTSGHAPTPFTAEQIRRGCPDGRQIAFRIRQEGQPELHNRMRFDDGDEGGASVESTMLTATGTTIGEPQRARSSWSELQAHASFPITQTTIIPVDDVGSELGPMPGWLYRVRQADGGTKLLWFATSLPGPPVRMIERDGHGHAVLEMTMVSNTASGGKR